ncbi:glycosyltransferase family 4 protein [Paenibacillus rhizovicinus]|uniref:Glycosyltransferase family 4 protein n=1 Tax=Paenibacillus rhizovicinus TaxID=2704463 RepID=A0A6C0NVI6_9BACL|nr:glycosyltransferase [Paenibacillus rhizovicinus]QHW29936.1 glycosyltransferase family 4 protein [Paenibacillus rhizovicinus]
MQTAGLHVPVLNLPAVSHYAPQPSARQASGSKLAIVYLVHAFYPESYTGTEKFVLQAARTMQQRGHRVKVIACSSRIPEQPAENAAIASQEYMYEGIPVLTYRSPSQEDPASSSSFDGGDPRLSAFADELLTREQPDLLHVAHAMYGAAFVQSARKLGIPYVMTLTDYWFACPKSTLIRNDRQLCAGPEGGAACMTHCQIPYAGERLQALMPLLQTAACVTAPSAFLAAYMKSVMPPLNVEVVPHGMRYEWIAPNRKTYQAGDRITLVYGGSLGEHKGVHVLLAAMAMVPSRRLRLHVYGAGPPEYTESLRRAAYRDKRISFRGTYTEADTARIYQEADIAIVPSVWYENYPLTLHEALASRVPVIASNIGGMAEKITDGLNGFTFRVGDARHLAARLKLLLRRPAMINGLKARIDEMPLPSLDVEMNAYEAMYYAHARYNSG